MDAALRVDDVPAMLQDPARHGPRTLYAACMRGAKKCVAAWVMRDTRRDVLKEALRTCPKNQPGIRFFLARCVRDTKGVGCGNPASATGGTTRGTASTCTPRTSR